MNSTTSQYDQLGVVLGTVVAVAEERNGVVSIYIDHSEIEITVTGAVDPHAREGVACPRNRHHPLLRQLEDALAYWLAPEDSHDEED